MELSARNQLRGRIRGVKLDTLMAEITVALGNGETITSVITRASAERLALKDGDQVVVIKATELPGLVEHPGPLSVAALQRLTPETVSVSFACGKGIEHHSYVGVRLAAVIEQAGLKVDRARKNDKLRDYVVVTANDGYEVAVSWGEIDPEFGNAPILLAWSQDGQPLRGTAGLVRLVVPGDKKGGRYVAGVDRIDGRGVDSAPRR